MMHSLHKCKICKEEYSLAELKKHKSEVHGHLRNIPCPNCTTMFYTQKELQAHIKG